MSILISIFSVEAQPRSGSEAALHLVRRRERYMWNGNNGAFQAYATLRVSGDGLDPHAISSALNLTPSTSGAIESGFGTWCYSTRDFLDNLSPLEAHLSRLLQLLEPRSAALAALRQKFATEVFCHFASQSDLGGFHLSADTLFRLGRLGLDFDVDEYFCCDAPPNA